jgi:hypothetical protein
MTTKLESDVKELHVAGAMRTDVGRVRSANEDTVVFVAPAADVSTPQALKAAFEAANQEIIDYGA